jgi:GTPase-associated protein 1, N-terminal domain type 2
MQVEQAIFTSIRTGRIQGYQLAARSDGVDDRLAQTLTKWGPSHAALCNPHPAAESFNFHAVESDCFAISRTLYGGAEYSARGGWQLMTRYALVEPRHLRDFENDPIALLRLARSEGRFELLSQFDERLPPMSLPEPRPSVRWSVPARKGVAENVDEIIGRLERGERLAVTHCYNPLTILQYLIRRLPESHRLELSFTTGLKPTAHRPFRLHFLPGDSHDLRRAASALGITCLSASG